MLFIWLIIWKLKLQYKIIDTEHVLKYPKRWWPSWYLPSVVCDTLRTNPLCYLLCSQIHEYSSYQSTMLCVMVTHSWIQFIPIYYAMCYAHKFMNTVHTNLICYVLCSHIHEYSSYQSTMLCVMFTHSWIPPLQHSSKLEFFLSNYFHQVGIFMALRTYISIMNSKLPPYVYYIAHATHLPNRLTPSL